MNEHYEKLHEALAELDKKTQPETDEIYIRLLVRHSRPSPVPAMPYDLYTDVQAALAGYRSRDGIVSELNTALRASMDRENAKQLEIDRLTQEKADLERWKAEALQVESMWDVQAVGNALGMPMGSMIVKGILPGILKLQQDKAELLAELAESQKWNEKHADRLAEMYERLDEPSPSVVALLEEVHDSTVNASPYPDGPNLEGELRRRIAALLTKAKGDQ